MKVSAIVLGVFAAASQALVPIHRVQKVIPDQYIVMLKASADLSSHIDEIKSFMTKAGADNEILHQYSMGDDFKGYALRCSEEVLQYIREREDIVEYVEEDQIMSIHDVQTNPPSWGLDRVDQRNLPLNSQYNYPTSAGNGVNTYVIDTGILTTHTDFGGRAIWGYNAVPGSSNTDRNGHGTHVAGTMVGTRYGLAKRARTYAVKVLGDNGSGSNAGVIDGVNWACNQGASARSVGNMSLGGGASSTLDSAVNNCVSRGFHMAVAAGNDNANACNYSPARANGVTVGSTDSADRKSSFSNHGSCVDIHAPGTSITSAWIGSNSDSRTISGTSMASPHVAGVMTIYRGEGRQPTLATLQSGSTRNVISGLPSGTINALVYTHANLPFEEEKEPEIFF